MKITMSLYATKIVSVAKICSALYIDVQVCPGFWIPKLAPCIIEIHVKTCEIISMHALKPCPLCSAESLVIDEHSNASVLDS